MIPWKVLLHGTFVTFWCLLFAVQVYAHAVSYDVAQKKLISVQVLYTASDPVNYAEYELHGPGDTLPHQVGRTDKNGFVTFLPDRTGIWRIRVKGESSHGLHGATVEVRVDDALDLKSFNKPFVKTLSATLIKLLVGISLIIGVFGLYTILRHR
ncbi:conserved hypothetical protein, membrane [Candidatus Magnetobacterium bavaricum]|uniref:Uncharacterized protein n=1 Tax=Candidatus Magnetobacterium bavaricum TaxID=29290 RepID=A0A0F3GN11_9BACT|nr:conserved hypothetical protein, membrane [Candidatus Magnetobacterium bavaricum]